MTDDAGVSSPDQQARIAQTMDIPQVGQTPTLRTQERSQSLATTIKNTMWLGIEEMQNTFAQARQSRGASDPNEQWKISLDLVKYEAEIKEKRKPAGKIL